MLSERRPDRDDAAGNGTWTEEREHELTMHVFAISSAMVGVCLTGIGLLRVVVSQTRVSTIGDDLLAADAVLFMVCSSLCFWSFKTGSASRRRTVRWVIDVLFMLALLLMVVVCGLITYAIA